MYSVILSNAEFSDISSSVIVSSEESNSDVVSGACSSTDPIVSISSGIKSESSNESAFSISSEVSGLTSMLSSSISFVSVSISDDISSPVLDSI